MSTAPKASLADRLHLFVATGFYSGLSPVAPGTAGTAAAALLAYGLSLTSLPANITLASLFVLSCLLCLVSGQPAERLLGKKDPGAVVMDEFAGFYVSLLTLSATWPTLGEYIVAFGLFRLFDIAKPTPARQLQSLGGARGILLDDVAAGLYALVGVTVYRDFL